MATMTRRTWTATRDDYLSALADQNPWHKLGRVPESLAFLRRRPLADKLWATLIDQPGRYQMVLGPRRVGKTVSMHQTIQVMLDRGVAPERLWFLRLDHPLLMHFELDGWVRSLINNYGASESNPLYLFLDEINYSTHWDKWLKTFFDERWPLRIVATSSSTAALRDRTVESGIGRWSEQFLMPYSFFEFLRLTETPYPPAPATNDLYEALRSYSYSPELVKSLSGSRDLFLLTGGFPELLLQGRPDEPIEEKVIRSQRILRSEAVQRVAGMDIPQVFDIKHPQILERLVYILAGQMCGLANVSSLAAALEISRPTVDQYIQYLVKSFLVFALHNYSTSEETVQRQGKKIYFVDGAVRNAALQRGLAPITDPTEKGYLVENSVGSHLFGLAQQTGRRLYHWRRKGDEVDFVYDGISGPIAFEVSTSSKHSLSGLKSLEKRYPQFKNRLFLISSANSVVRMPESDPDGIGRMPLDLFLLVVGSQADTALSGRLGIEEAH